MIEQSERYAEIGQKIIKEKFPQLQDVQIAWLVSDKEKKSKGRIIFGECAKVPEKYSWCCPYDFTITIYETNTHYFTDEQIKILMEHEILHIGADKEEFYVVPHDIEEFRSIIDRYGMDWCRDNTDYALLD